MNQLSLPWSDGVVLLTFPGTGLPAPLRFFLLLALIAVPLALVCLLYRYELRLVRRLTALSLLGLRLCVFSLIVALLCLQPVYARQRKIDEPGRVLVFVDRSASMDVRDPTRDPIDKLRIARRFAPERLAADRVCLDRWIADLEAGREPAWLTTKETQDIRRDPGAARTAHLLEAERRQLYTRAIATVDDLTRTETARRLLAGDKGLLAGLAKKHTVELFGFDRGVEAASSQNPDELFSQNSPGRDATNITQALRYIQEHASSQGNSNPLAILLLTDGQHNEGSPPVPEASALGEQKIPIYSIAFGSTRLPPTLSVVSLQGPEQTVYQGVDIDIDIEARIAGQKPGDYILELTRPGPDGEQIIADSKPIHHTGKDHVHRDRFKVTLEQTGPQTFTATLRPAQPAPDWKASPKDQRSTTVAVADDRAVVLLVDGEARWEYHYLEAALKRDRIVQLDRLVFEQPRLDDRLSPAQEKTLDLASRQWPGDSDEWLANRSLVILGDVDPQQLSFARRQALEKFVADGGALVVVAGKRFMPLAYPESAGGDTDPLRKLLPIEQPAPHVPESGFPLRLTRAGQRTRFMELDADMAENAQLWAGHPRRWAWAISGRAKPGAVPLATANDLSDQNLLNDQRERDGVVVARHNYGFGRVLFVGIDSTWRWRFKVGDLYHHRFWGQVVRWAAERPLMVGNKIVRFGSSQPVYRPGDSIEVVARVTDPAARPNVTVGARIFRLPDNANEPEQLARVAPLLPGAGSLLTSKLTGLPAGRYAIEMNIPEKGGIQKPDPGKNTKDPSLRAKFSVIAPPERELIDLECNEELLQQLATATSGLVYRPEDADALVTLLAAATHTRVEEHSQPLWRWWVVLVLLATLLSAEWVARKWAGLP